MLKSNKIIMNTTCRVGFAVLITFAIFMANCAPVITYEGSPFMLNQNSVITTIKPILSGDAITGCSSSPALPTGLFLDETTCEITGVPMAISAATTYTITGTNNAGNGMVDISIEIISDKYPVITYSGTPYTFAVKNAIEAITPVLTGYIPTDCIASPSLPAGLSIDPASCEIRGTPTTESGSTDYTITATNTAGTGSTTISIAVTTIAGTRHTFNAGGVTFNMRDVPAKTTFMGNTDSVQSNVGNAYTIAETEVTYQLWETIYTWATANGYTFANAGHQGGDMNGCLDPAVGTNEHPVTCINWRDAIVWCNALTEYYNAKNTTSFAFVYTSDAAFATPIKNSADGTFSASIDYPKSGSFDDPYVNSKANGFRLPTDTEWELAARYIADSNNDGDIMDTGEYYPGSHVSGDTTADVLTSIVMGQYGWYMDNSGAYTTGHETTHPVGTKTANALGLYDMSGNVCEWEDHWDSVGTFRGLRNGCFSCKKSFMQVGSVYGEFPYTEALPLGFRIARTP